MGRRWRAWRRLGERERRERGSGGSCWRLGEQQHREWAAEARWRCGEMSARIRCAVWGESKSAAVCGTGRRPGARLASQEASAGPGGPRVVLPGTREGGKFPTLHGSAA